MEAASIRQKNRVSNADAFAMGLAKELGTKLVTGGREIRDAASSEALAIDWLGV
jgi:predicted nucleic acid-binding protein